MDPRNQRALEELWRSLWSRVERRRDLSDQELGDRFEDYIVSAMNSGMFVGLREYEDYGILSGPYDRRPRPARVRVQIRRELNNYGRSRLYIDVDCPAISRDPWSLCQPLQDDSMLSRMRDIIEARQAIASLSEGEARKLFDGIDRSVQPKTKLCEASGCGEKISEWMTICPKCVDKKEVLTKLVRICQIIANAVAVRWALVWGLGRPVVAREKMMNWTYRHCPVHSIHLGTDCLLCAQRREELSVGMAVLRNLCLLAAWCRWQDVDDSEKRFMQLEIAPTEPKCELVFDGRTDADDRFALLELSATPAPVRPRPVPKSYVRPPPREPEPEPTNELLLELY